MNFREFEHITLELTEQEFETVALELFRFQFRHNPVYNEFVQLLGKNPQQVHTVEQIPFLPIELFKTHRVITFYSDRPDSEFVKFRSSGTTGMERSTHYIYNITVYEKSFTLGFEQFYGPVEQYVILALLPSYLERTDSSLIYMTKRLIELTGSEHSGFYLYNYKQLYDKLLFLKRHCSRKVILLGVSFALLDFAQEYGPLDFPELIVMETGGMKGRRQEMVRQELHQILMQAFGVEQIHSEYGMTELLSQAYSQGQGIFHTPPWLRILIRDTNDPLTLVAPGTLGGINVIDLANVYSCAFIQTQDLGRLHPGGSFEVLGRFDNSDLRGCNLLVA